MKRLTALWMVILLAFLSGVGLGEENSVQNELLAQTDLSDSSLYAPGEVLIKWASGMMKTEASDTLLVQLGGTRIQSFESISIDHVRLPEGRSVESAIAELKGNPKVVYAEPNYTRKLNATPNDTHFSLQWGLHNSGQKVDGVTGIADADIDAPEAWDISTGSKGVVVAVIDTGIDWSQPDLYANLWFNPGEGATADGVDNDHNGYVDDTIGWNFGDDDNTPIDEHGHGSHVAGIIGAAGNNGAGTTGVCWNISLMPLRVMDNNGNIYVSSEIKALEYAYNKQVKIINISMGNYTFSQSEKDAIDLNYQAVVVCAAGNDGGNNENKKHYPSSYASPNIIAVAASDQADNLASFSNYGGTTVDLAAPGVNILSTIDKGGFDYYNGTSMAAPMVTGTAALVLSVASISPAEVIQAILTTVDVNTGYVGKMVAGGRLNAYRAVAAVSGGDDDDGGGGGCFIQTTLWK